MRSLMTLAILMLGAVPSSHAGGSECVYYPDAFRWEGFAQGPLYLFYPAYRGNHIVFTSDDFVSGVAKLAVFDVSTPAEPRLVLEIGSLPVDTTRVVAPEDIYILRREVGATPELRLVDLSNPLEPVVVGFVRDPRFFRALAVQDSLLFLGVSDFPTSALQVWNIANPNAPFLLAERATPRGVGEIVPHGDLLLLSMTGRTVHLWDISEPLSPVPRGSVNLEEVSIQDVAAVGDAMYIADYYSGIHAVDISDPDDPAPIPFSAPVAHKIKIVGSRLFFATNLSVGVAELVDPFTIEVEREWPLRRALDEVVDVHPVGDWLLLSENGGVHTMDWTRSSDVVTPLGAVSLGNVRDIAAAGHHVYVAGPGGFVMSIADPHHPTIVGEIQLPAPYYGVDIDAGRLYYALDSQGFYVARLDNPLNPTRESWSLFGPRWRSVEVEGDLAVLGTNASELTFVDVSVPAAPVVRSVLPLPFAPGRLDVVGRLVYVPGGGGVTIIDMSDLETPQVRGFVATPGSCVGVEVDGVSAYVADGIAGLTVLNVSDPDFPALVANLGLEGSARDVDVEAPIVYVATGNPRLVVVDVLDPADPQVMGTIYGAFGTERILAHQGVVIQAGQDGMQINPGHCRPTALDFAGLRAEIIGRAVRILWRAPLSGRSAYRVYRSESAVAPVTEVTRESVEGAGELQFLDDLVSPNMTYWYRVADARSGALSNPIVVRTPAWPDELASLEVVGANPSRVDFALRFSMPAEGPARLAVYDVAGRLVRVIREGRFSAGAHGAAWDARDAAGHRTAAGTYFAVLSFDKRSVRRKLVYTP